MSKETTPTTAPITRTGTTQGVVPGVVHLALDVAERSQRTTLALVQDGRTELAAIVIGGIDLAERATGAVFRLLKKAAQRLDEGTAETLASFERVATTTVKTARDTTSTALNGLVGGARETAAA
jgi:hypothetical protein